MFYGMAKALTFDFSEIRMKDVPLVGAENASLGELFSAQ
jgi:phosphoenolpyruvate synthase/pyruvate phosphate dikinase